MPVFFALKSVMSSSFAKSKAFSLIICPRAGTSHSRAFKNHLYTALATE